MAHLTLATQKSLAAALPADKFIRLQRSFIVSVDSITAYSVNSVWIDDTEIKIGEQYKLKVAELLKNRLNIVRL